METKNSNYIDPALFSDSYTMLEKAYLLRWLFERRGISREEIIHTYLPKLQCEAHESVLDYHLELLKLEGELKKWVVSFELSLKLSVRLARLSLEDQKSVALLPEKLSLNSNEFKNIFESLEEVAVKNHKSIAELVSSLLEESNFKEALFSKKFPRTFASRKKWQELKKKALFNTGIRVKDPVTFEEPYVQLDLQVKDREDLKRKIDSLKKLEESREFEELLKLL